MFRSRSNDSPPPRYDSLELDQELSRSYDDVVDASARDRLVLDVAHDDHDSAHAFVRFQSPRSLQDTAARVANIVQQHHQITPSDSTRSSSPLPSPTPTPMPAPAPSRPHLRSMRSLAQLRSQRQLSMASDKSNGSNPSTTSHENGSDLSHDDAYVPLRSQSHHHDCHGHGHGSSGNTQTAMLHCPSSHYYIDAQGHLQVRRTWWLYTRVRRLMGHLLPGFKRDDNTFLCAPMITNTTLILTIYVLRVLINDALLTALLSPDQQKECHEFSSEFLDFFSFSLLGNALLCIPAFNLSMFKLFRRVKPEASCESKNKTPQPPPPVHGGALSIEPLGGVDATDAPVATAAAADGAVVHDDDHPKLKKTYLFTACELLVIVEIPYLVYIFLTMFIPAAAIADSKATHSDLWSVSARCANALSSGVFLAFVLAQTIGVLAYVLRWKQIIIFHRMHEHFLFQRGCVPGRARFDYVEQSFGVSCFASAHTKRVHAIKSRLYHAAKYGDLDQVRAQLEAATLLDGPDFAHKWYENTGFLERVFGRRFVKCQRNPLHVAVAFDNAEIVEELLSNGMFDIHELEKMELLKLNVSWIYRFFFDIVPFLRMSNYSRHQTRLVFGPTGLFCSTLLTPLHVAVSMGNTDMVLLLLRFGADPNRSAASSHRKFVTPPLFWAINKECTRLLLDADANPVFVPGRGYFLTAFEVARLVGNHAVAMEIEKYGGDVALTPLHDAAARGLKNEVRFYLEHGANPDTFGEKVTGFFRRTPLHWAAIRGEAKVVKLLLKYGADLDAKDAFGRTALTWACLLNRVKTVQVLLKFGADVDIRDIQGDPLLCILAAGTCSSPSSEAFTSDAHRHDAHRRMTRTEHDAAGGGRNDYTTSQTAKTLDPDIFEMLQRSGIDIHATREANGDTALHVALRKNNEATAILLVRAGMSLTAVNYVGQRAMDCTTSSSLRYAIKKEAGHRDVMISYTHSHSALARKVRDALEGAYVTTWIDSMDPSGITGGSVWRQEIAQGIRSSALVLALLTTDYPMSQWCMKELAFAKMHNVPIVAIQCEDMQMTEELQVYLWTRQIVDFRAAFGERVVEVVDEADDVNGERGHAHLHDLDDDEALLAAQDPRDAVEGDGAVARPKVVVQHEYDDETFHNCIRLLLDGIHDQIEEHRVRRAQRQQRQKMLLRARATVQEDDVPLSSDEDDGLDDGDAGGLCGIMPRNLRANADLAETDRDGVVLDEPLAMSPASRDRGAYVFIAHGDYHLQFCQRLRNALQKNGVRCIVDQSVPSIQYGSSLAPTSAASHTTSPRRLNRLQSNVTVQSGGGGYGSGSDVATTTAHARQLAAKDAILECSAVIVVLSPISSKCDMLADQLAFAEDRGKLIVPLMLSLQTIDLAKRYTFSRSVVQHFNVSIGFDQSLERLVVYLMQTAEAMQRQQQQKDAAFQHQLRLARRQRRKERARRRRRRDGLGTPSQAGSEEDENDDDDDELDAVSPASSPASSVRSAASRVSAVRVLSPSHFNMLPPPADGSGLPPTIPILQPTRQPSTGATSGHGWSVTPSASSGSAGGGTGGLVRQSSLGPVGDSTPRQQQRESRHHFGTEPLLRRTTSMQAPARSDHTSGDL